WGWCAPWTVPLRPFCHANCPAETEDERGRGTVLSTCPYHLLVVFPHYVSASFSRVECRRSQASAHLTRLRCCSDPPGASIFPSRAHSHWETRRPFPERARRKRQRIPRRTSARCRMVKKRRSVQSLFATVVQLASAPDSPARPASPSPRTHARTRTRSRASSAATLSPASPSPSSSSSRFGSVSSLPDLPLLELGTARRHSPPPDLLDSDPFANLSPAPSERSPRLPPLDFSDAAPVSPLRSPLASPVLPRPAELVRPKSSGQAQSAHTRPAFRPRPSLPSLNTLAQSHVVVPKVRTRAWSCAQVLIERT
ncbi:hypothetical protein BKA93DRAFT_764395, partial [Sparassis latifolia]